MNNLTDVTKQYIPANYFNLCDKIQITDKIGEYKRISNSVYSDVYKNDFNLMINEIILDDIIMKLYYNCFIDLESEIEIPKFIFENIIDLFGIHKSPYTFKLDYFPDRYFNIKYILEYLSVKCVEFETIKINVQILRDLNYKGFSGIIKYETNDFIYHKFKFFNKNSTNDPDYKNFKRVQKLKELDEKEK